MDTIKENGQMSLENFKKKVEEEIKTANYIGKATRMRLLTEVNDDLEIYLEDNFTPQETLMALVMGY